MSKTVIEDWFPSSTTTEKDDGSVETQVTVIAPDDPSNFATALDDVSTALEVVAPDVHVREVYIPGTKGEKGDKGDRFVFEDFTDAQLESILVRQPPLDPSPVELFDSILNEVP